LAGYRRCTIVGDSSHFRVCQSQALFLYFKITHAVAMPNYNIYSSDCP
jgi:hypothetical protein